ncbi:MAG: hypothetical protein ACYCQK_01605 [Acidiferrobacteraceae bacterium]
MKSFMDVGTSLMAIRDERLYPAEHETFEVYCQKRWGFSRRRAYQLIEGATVVRDLQMCTMVHTAMKKSGEKVQIVPENERQARAIADAAPDAKTRERIWVSAVQAAPKDESGKPVVTAAQIKRVAAAVVGPQPSSNGSVREPGDDGTQPEHDDTLRDALGGALPPKLRPVFAQVPEFRRIAHQIGLLRGSIDELQRSDAGAYLPIAEISSLLGKLKSAVKFACPHTECPKCRRKPDKDCKVCEGILWTTEPIYDRSKTKEDEKWLKSR